MTVFRWGASSHPGRVRPGNQDAVHADRGMFVVADGMGGHRAGEIASQLTVKSIAAAEIAGIDDMVDAVKTANQVVHASSMKDPDLAGMGTTVTSLVFTGNPVRGVLANVGDSRAYRFRDGELSQLTDDHSYVAALIREGSITVAEAEAHPYRNMLTRAIGIETDVEVDSWELEIADGDRFLLCSDGLINELSNDQVAATMRRLVEPEDTARELIRQANERGGRDNITVIIVDAQADSEAPSATEDRSAVVDDATPSTPADLAALVPPAGTPAPLDEEDLLDLQPETTATEPLPVLDGAATALAEPTADDGTDVTDAFAALTAERSGRVGDEFDEFDDGEPRPPLLTWRALLMAFAIIAVFVVAFGAVGLWARSGAHVGFSGDEVSVYEGRPGSVLWFSPTLVERTGILRDELPESVVESIDDGRTADSVDDARAIVDELRAELDGSAGASTSSPSG